MTNQYIDYLNSLEDDDEKKKKKNQGAITTTQTPEKPSGNKYLDYVREREKDKPAKTTTKTTVIEPEPTKNFLERAKEIVSNVFKKKDEEEEVKQQQVTEQAQVGIKTDPAKNVNAPESDEQIDAVMNELLTQEQQKFIDQKKPPKNLFNVDLNKAYDDILLQNLESRYIKLNAEHQSEKPRQKVMDRLETEIQEIESAVNDSGNRKLNVAHKYGTARVSEKAKATIAGTVKSILDFFIVAPTELDTHVRTKSAIKEEAIINKALDEMKVSDPAKRQEYIEKFSSRYQKNPLRPNEATLAEKAKEMEKAKAEGQKGLKVVLEKYIADQEPANPTLADDIVGAITSMATFYGAGVVAGIGKVASVAPTVLESVQEAGSVYDTNRKNGLDPDESIKQMYKDFVGNLLWNHYANKFSRIFDGDDKLAKTFKDKVFKTINAMKWEGIQEAGQQLQSNVFTYAEDVFDGVMKSFGLGALVSGGVTAVTVQTESPDTSEGKLYRGVNKDRKQSKIPYEEGVTFYTTDRATAEDYANAQEDDVVKDLKQQRDEVKKKLVEDKESVELKDQLDSLNQQIKDRQTEISKNPESKKTKENTGTVVETNNPLENPLVVDAKGQTFDQVNKSAIEQARKEGRDGVIINNVIDSINTKNAKPITTVLVFNQGNIVDQKMKEEGWAGGDAMKAKFDEALLLKDTQTVSEMLPEVPTYYKERFSEKISEVLGGQEAQALSKSATNDTQTKQNAKTVSDTNSTVKVENQKVYRGVAGKVSSEVKSFDNVLEVEGYQVQLLQKMAKDGIEGAQEILDARSPQGKVDFVTADALIRKTYQGDFDAIKYTNKQTGVSGRSLLGNEYHELSTNNFYAENESTAKLYAQMKGRDQKYKPQDVKASQYKTADEFIEAWGTPAFHGTSADFTDFDISKSGNVTQSDWGKGIYLTNKREVAKSFADDAVGELGGKPKVMEVIVNLKNPAKNADVVDDDIQRVVDDNMGFESMDDVLKSKGFDGIEFTHTDGSIEYVVFNSEQVKTKEQLTDIWNKANKDLVKTFEDQLEDGDIDAFEYQEAVNNDRKKDSYRSQADYNAVAPSSQKQEQRKESAEEEIKFTGYNTTESARELTKNISPIEFPELLRMARLISGNKTLVKKLRSRMGGTVLGQHQAGKITLNPEIFEDSELVAKVFAHEFGHMVDFFPDRSMDRGNILGRVASLRGYMAKFLSEFEGADGKPLTAKEREALRKQAEQLAKKPVTITTEEIIGSENIDPKDILAIWNDATSAIKNPELLKYIQKLSDAQKKQIVVSAMKGTIPEWVTFKKSVKKTITKEVLQNSPEDIKKIFNKLVKNEVYKRRLFEAEVMTEELKNNTRLWSPFDPTVSPRYTAYRYSSKELYAEALSVLFNDPQLLQKNAPTFYTGFFNYMDAKPEVYKALSDVYSLIASGSDAVLDARQAEINESFKLAEDKWRLARENKRKRDVDLMFELKNFWMERHTKLFDKVKETQKSGAVIPANENPRYFLEEMTRDGAVLKTYFSEQIQPIHDTLNASQISWDDLGSVLLYERVINERGELANPFGQNPKTAQAGLDRMKAQMGSTKWEVLQTQLKAFRKATDHVLKEAEKEGFYKKELLEKMKANPAYATFQVVDYIDSDFATSAIYEQVGTLSGIANAGTSTVMKNLAILNAIEKNKAKRAVVKFMNGFHKEDIVEAPYVYNATKKIREPRAPRDPKLGIIELMDGGNKRGFYVDKYIAKSFEFLGAKDMNVLLKALNFVNTKQFRPMVITFNLGFQSVNLMRDFIRTYKALPTYNLPRVLARYVQAIPASARRAWDVPDATITEMNKIKALGVTYNDIMQGATAEDTQIDALIDKLGKSPVRTSSYNILKRPFVSILGTIEKLGDTIETLPKVASYNELKGKLPEKELSHFIRTQVGSPDFWAGGTGKAFTNNVFLFSNAIIQSIRADIHTATDPSTRTGWWVKTAMLSLMPKLLMYAVLNGLMGDDEDKKVMEMATEFDRSNYTIIPLGLDENGQGNYMRIPQDETGKIIGAVFWKMITASSNDQELLKDVADIVNTMGGQVPSMSPYLKTLTTTAQFLQGQNPYDTFRGRNIIPDTEFQAGGKYALKPFLTWQLNNLGAGVVFNTQYTTQAPETRTWAQKAQETPVLGNLVSRWFRTTSYGQVEKNRQIINNVRQQKAKERIEKNLKVQDAVTLYKEGNQSISARTKIERQLVADVVGKPPYRGARKTQVTNVIKQFRISLVKGKADPTINSLISAVSNEEKFELLREVKPTLSKEEYIKLRTDLLKYKIVSGDVFKKLEREVK